MTTSGGASAGRLDDRRGSPTNASPPWRRGAVTVTWCFAAVGELLAEDTTERWVGRLAALGLVVAGVETVEQALASAHVAHRGMVVTIDTPAGPLRAVGNPIKVRRRTLALRSAAAARRAQPSAR